MGIALIMDNKSNLHISFESELAKTELKNNHISDADSTE